MLKDEVAVVTGSTSGIGLGIARRLGDAGADLMLNGLGDPAEIERLHQDLGRELGVLGGRHEQARAGRRPGRSG